MKKNKIKRALKVDIAQSMNKLKIITNMLISTKFLKEYISIFRGKGLEFEYFRDYTLGDDASLIDWKASARTKNLLVRKYVEEKKLEVFFLVDISNSMVFGSTEKLKNEYTAELVVALANAVLSAGDKVGYALFNSDVTARSHPLAGKKQFYNLARELVNPATYGGGFDIYQALKFSSSFLKPGGIVFVISDFIGLKDHKWKTPLKWLSSKSDVICLMIRDPRDKMLPKDIGQVLISDPYSHRKIVVDSKLISTVYQSYVNKQEKELKNVVKESKVQFIPVYTDQPFIKPIVELFITRKKTWK